MTCRNLKSAYENHSIVSSYLQKEKCQGRILGPFPEPPYPIFRCNPIGIVPKKAAGKFRTIVNLSAPKGISINDFISKEDFSLSYVTIDKAIDFILELGKGCFLSKVDIVDAFRIMPVSPHQWHLLGLSWDNLFYVDTRLSMGSRSSPFIFDSLSVALEWICMHNYELRFLCHLLDDFLAAESIVEKGNALSVIRYVFHLLGIPLVPEKLEGPATRLEFLGITLDTILLEASLSVEKIEALKDKLRSFLGKKKASKRDLLSLIGSLSFACKVVVPGRRFLSRLIALSCSVRELHFMVYLNTQVKYDIQLWLGFLQDWNGRNFFLDRFFLTSVDLDFYTDACEIGYGGFLAGTWFAEIWLPHQQDWSMPCKELYPIMIATIIWGARFSGKRVLVHCDNLPVVNFLNKGYTSREPAATMLRKITLSAMSNNFALRCVHIEGAKNTFADLLSRQRIAEFLAMCTYADKEPTAIPQELKMAL